MNTMFNLIFTYDYSHSYDAVSVRSFYTVELTFAPVIYSSLFL